MNITLKRVLLVSFLAIVVGRSLLAQPDVDVFIDIPDPRLRSTMQRNASAFLSEINRAHVEVRALRFGRYVSNRAVRSAMIAEWAQERFRIPDAKLIETALKKNRRDVHHPEHPCPARPTGWNRGRLPCPARLHPRIRNSAWVRWKSSELGSLTPSPPPPDTRH